MPLADTGETTVLDSLLAGRFVSLHTSVPPASEVSGGAYARQAATFAKTSGPDPTIYKNSALITYPTASASWGNVTHFGIWSAASGGTLLAYNTLASNKNIDSGDVVRWDPNTLVVDTN